MMKRHPHFAMTNGGTIVQMRVFFIECKYIVVFSVSVTMQLSNDVRLSNLVGGLYRPVEAGLILIGSLNAQVFVIDGYGSGSRERSHGMKAIREMAIIPILFILSHHAGIVPIRLFRTVPSRTHGFVFHLIIVHHRTLLVGGVRLISADGKACGQKCGST